MITNEMKIQAGAAMGLAGLMAWLNIRPLGAILTTLLLAVAYKQVYPNAKLQVPYEVQTNLNTLYENFAKLRKDKPGTFCTVISGGLLTVAIVGHLISGTWLVLGVLIGIFFLCAKYQVRLVNGEIATPPSATGTVGYSPDHEIDEFIPDVSDELNKSLLTKMAEDADVSHFYKTKTGNDAITGAVGDDKSDDSDVPSDLLPTSNKIPEIEEEEATGSFPSSYEDEIELPRSGYQSYEPATKQVNVFDSSDDSDDSISRGLNFNDVSLPDAPCSGVDGLSLTSASGNFSMLAQSSSFMSPSSVPSAMSASHPIPLSSSSHPPQPPPPSQAAQQVGNNSPTWNIVNNLWDAAQSCIPEIVPNLVPAAPGATTTLASTKHATRRLASADLSSDESDFELLDTDDLNIHNT